VFSVGDLSSGAWVIPSRVTPDDHRHVASQLGHGRHPCDAGTVDHDIGGFHTRHVAARSRASRRASVDAHLCLEMCGSRLGPDSLQLAPGLGQEWLGNELS